MRFGRQPQVRANSSGYNAEADPKARLRKVAIALGVIAVIAVPVSIVITERVNGPNLEPHQDQVTRFAAIQMATALATKSGQLCTLLTDDAYQRVLGAARPAKGVAKECPMVLASLPPISGWTNAEAAQAWVEGATIQHQPGRVVISRDGKQMVLIPDGSQWQVDVWPS